MYIQTNTVTDMTASEAYLGLWGLIFIRQNDMKQKKGASEDVKHDRNFNIWQ